MTENFQSEFIFGLQGRRYQDFVDIIASPIIEKVIKTKDYEIVSFDKHLSFADFDYRQRKQSIFPEFYLNFLGDIIKESNNVSFKKKVCITLDERLCTDICQNTGRKITVIKLAGVDLAYLIYFDVKEFFDFVYNFDEEVFSRPQNQNNFVKKVMETNKKEDLEITTSNKDDDSSVDLNSIDLSKFFSGRKETEGSLHSELVERVGYIDNINTERGLSFIRDSDSGTSGFPIMHSDFPEVINFPIGTIIKANGYFDSEDNRFFVDSYEIGEPEDLPFQLLHFKGTLRCHDTKRYAIIRVNNIGSVFVTSDLLSEYSENIIYNVKCIAIQAYDKKRDTMGWKAIYVENLEGG